MVQAEGPERPAGRAGPFAGPLLFAVLATAVTWPLPWQIASHAPGAPLWNGRPIHAETAVNLWNLWWFRHALLELRQNPFDCTYLFYPVGADLWLHTLSPLPATVSALLQPIVGLVAAFNLLVIASFVLAGACAAAAGRRLGLGAGGAIVAGALYAFSPAVLAHLYAGHFELLWTFWMPAALLAFLRLIDPAAGARRWPASVLLGLTIAGAAYTSPYYALYSAELVGVGAAVHWRAVARRPVVAGLVLAAIIAAVAVSPFAVKVARGARGVTGTAESVRRDFRDFSVEPAGFFIPSFMHPVLSRPLRPLHERMNRGRALPQETTGYLGLSVLALAAAAIVRRRPVELRLAGAVALAFLVLSLGAELKVLGAPTGFPLPAAALAEMPIVRLARAPGRHVIVAALGLGVLAAAAWERAGRPWQVFLIALIAFELWPRVPLMSTAVPDVYARIAREPGDFAVLDVPPGVRDGSRVLGSPDPRRLLAQTVHHKPIVDGMASRLPDRRWSAIVAAPVVGTLLDPARTSPVSPARAEAYFSRWKIRAIVLHPEASPEDRRLIETSLTIAGRETFADGTQLWWVR